MLRLSFIVLMLFQFAGFSQSGNMLLKSLQEKFSSINSLSADFSNTSEGMKGLSGKLFYKKENKIRLELKNSVVISNGKTNWNYSRSKNQVVISDYDESDHSGFSLQKYLYDYPAECSISTRNASGKEVLVLVPENSSELNFSKVEITVNNDNLPAKISVDDSHSGLIEITLTNYNINQSIPDNKFTFSPPEGSRVIDLRAE